MKSKGPDQMIIEILSKIDSEEKVFILSQTKSIIDEIAPTTPSIIMEQYNYDLKKAEARIDSGSYFTHEEVVELAKKW